MMVTKLLIRKETKTMLKFVSGAVGALTAIVLGLFVTTQTAHAADVAATNTCLFGLFDDCQAPSFGRDPGGADRDRGVPGDDDGGSDGGDDGDGGDGGSGGDDDDGNNGHGNDDDHDDDSNPGNGKGHGKGKGKGHGHH